MTLIIRESFARGMLCVYFYHRDFWIPLALYIIPLRVRDKGRKPHLDNLTSISHSSSKANPSNHTPFHHHHLVFTPSPALQRQLVFESEEEEEVVVVEEGTDCAGKGYGVKVECHLCFVAMVI